MHVAHPLGTGNYGFHARPRTSILGPNRIIPKDVKVVPTVAMTVMTTIQRWLCNQRVACLLCKIKIFSLVHTYQGIPNNFF